MPCLFPWTIVVLVLLISFIRTWRFHSRNRDLKNENDLLRNKLFFVARRVDHISSEQDAGAQEEILGEIYACLQPSDTY